MQLPPIAAIRARVPNSTVAAVSAEGFLTRLGFGMVSLALPLFAVSLGMSLAEVGLLYALRTVAVIAIKPIMGWATDRYGRRTTLIIAVVLRCLVGLLFVFASQAWHLYALRILQGAMTAATRPRLRCWRRTASARAWRRPSPGTPQRATWVARWATAPRVC